MTVNSNLPITGPTTADGVTTSWPFSFKITSADQLTIIVTDADGSNLVEFAGGFTVADEYLNDEDGGIVVYPASGSPVATGKRVFVQRRVPYAQTVRIGNQGRFFPETHEIAFDRLAMQLQQLHEMLTRAVVVPVGALNTPDEILAAIASIEDITDEIATLAAVSGNIQTVAGISASVSALASVSAAIAAIHANLTEILLVDDRAAEVATDTDTVTAVGGQVAAAQATVEADKATVSFDKSIAAAAADDAQASANTAQQLLEDMLAGFATFDTRYLGAFGAPPATRPDTTPLQEGDLYFDIAIELMQIWNGVSWLNASGNPDQLLASNNLNDLASAATARTNLDVMSTAATQAAADAAPKAQLNTTAKGAIVDADRLYGGNSASAFDLVYATWAEAKAFLKTYFDGLYIASALLTTRGDVLRRGAAGLERLAVGAAGKVLQSDGTDVVYDFELTEIILKASDETSAIATGTNKVSFPLPFDCSFVDAWAGLRSVQTSGSILTVDINKAGVTILSTKLTIDNNEATSLTAATPRVISVGSGSKGDMMSIDVDQAGTGGAGLSVVLRVRRTA